MLRREGQREGGLQGRRNGGEDEELEGKGGGQMTSCGLLKHVGCKGSWGA